MVGRIHRASVSLLAALHFQALWTPSLRPAALRSDICDSMNKKTYLIHVAWISLFPGIMFQNFKMNIIFLKIPVFLPTGNLKVSQQANFPQSVVTNQVMINVYEPAATDLTLSFEVKGCILPGINSFYVLPFHSITCIFKYIQTNFYSLFSPLKPIVNRDYETAIQSSGYFLLTLTYCSSTCIWTTFWPIPAFQCHQVKIPSILNLPNSYRAIPAN